MRTFFLGIYILFCTYSIQSQDSPLLLQHPESVHAYEEYYLVSNIGKLLDAKKDGDGFISKIDAQGTIVEAHLFPNVPLHAPKGMTIQGDILYVTDIDRIVGITISSKQQVWEYKVPNGIFLNDITLLDSKTVQVSDSVANLIFEIDITQKKVIAEYKNYGGANGIQYEADGVSYMNTIGAQFDCKGNVYKKTKGESDFSILKNSPIGAFDGIAKLNDSLVLLSDWKNLKGDPGRLHVYNLNTEKSRKLQIPLLSPADFYVDKKRGIVIIPQTLLHKIKVFTIKELLEGYTIAANNSLFHYGFIATFLEGAYDGIFPYAELKEKGDFGLGAPDHLDGEITILNGQVYQTKADGSTQIPKDSEKTSYAMITHFNPEVFYSCTAIPDKAALTQYLDRILPSKNKMYALRITGTFTTLQTRAFPKITTPKPYPKLPSILDRQQFFDFENVKGTLVGFRLPSFVKGVNVPGYHFHFISEDEQHGGHMIAVSIHEAQLAVDSIQGYEVQLPSDEIFTQYNFNTDGSEALHKVETGKK